MKKILPFLFSLFALSFAVAQAPGGPGGYYDAAANKSCADLKTALKTIISTGVTPKSYSSLWTQYPLTDIKPRTVGTGSANVIYDIYSTIEGGTDPYQFTPGGSGSGGQCGTYSGEGGCYNREHSVPQSWFNGNTGSSGTATDYNFIFPTDGSVNGKRSNYPYGEVATASYTSKNGSKLGSSAVAGIPGTVFEPRDEFKGDVARAFLYFVTMYENSIPKWSTNPDAAKSFDSSTFPAVKLPFLQMMIKWHNQDPVSQKEIDRNNGTYTYQHNRNPFIDSPQYVNQIWNNTCPGLSTLPVSIVLFSGKLIGGTIALQWQVANEINLSGYEVQKSVNGTDFYAIGSVKADGSSNYYFNTDAASNSGGRVYFRLRKIDKDGKYSYSEVFTIHIPFSFKVSVYPNPASSFIHVSVNTTSASAQIVLTDIMGKNILSKAYNVSNNIIDIPTSHIANGSYYLKVVLGSSSYTQKIVIAK
ncbi:endonuclease [Parasediminibacterium sp. JCM 36343]|uniref:endonuclease n=1 Tax=Parasediminibacterium sp. JCM 36343 TaxID=3374279 RepID=UPI00397DEF8C